MSLDFEARVLVNKTMKWYPIVLSDEVCGSIYLPLIIPVTY